MPRSLTLPLLLTALLLTAAFLLPARATAFTTSELLPKAANSIAKQMDAQLMRRFATGEYGSKDKTRNNFMIMATVPVELNNLNISCPAARQFSEELARWFVTAGYRWQELRKGQDIKFDQRTGETLLTRDLKQLATRKGSSQAVLVGTYVISPIQVRFSMRLIHTPTNEVLAMGTETVPITDDLRPLLTDMQPDPRLKTTPSTGTRLH